MTIQSEEVRRLLTLPTPVISATHTIAKTEKILHVTYPATGAVSIEIPSAFATGVWYPVDIKDASGNAGVNNITITTEGSETIDGAATAVINSNYSAIKIYTDGTNFFIL